MHFHRAGDKRCITSVMTCDWCNDSETITTTITKRKLEWLGHVAWMPNHCMSKIWLAAPDPPTRRTLYDVARLHPQEFEVSWCSRNRMVQWGHSLKGCVVGNLHVKVCRLAQSNSAPAEGRASPTVRSCSHTIQDSPIYQWLERNTPQSNIPLADWKKPSLTHQ